MTDHPLVGFRRIHVTGNAGAGKTTAARLLGDRLGLPVYSLDSIVWQSGWRKTPMPVRAKLEQELVSRPAWIIDGVSKTVRDASDLVLFLDRPRSLCLARATMRTLRHLRSQRPEFPDGCREWRIYPRLLRIIWTFPAGAGHSIRQEARQLSKYCTIANEEELNALVAQSAAGA